MGGVCANQRTCTPRRCVMKLQTIYAVHDHMEDALRAFSAKDYRKAERAMWKAHDIVERITIAEQAKQGKV